MSRIRAMARSGLCLKDTNLMVTIPLQQNARSALRCTIGVDWIWFSFLACVPGTGINMWYADQGQIPYLVLRRSMSVDSYGNDPVSRRDTEH